MNSRVVQRVQGSSAWISSKPTISADNDLRVHIVHEASETTSSRSRWEIPMGADRCHKAPRRYSCALTDIPSSRASGGVTNALQRA